MNKKNNLKLFELNDKIIVLTGSAGRLGTNFAYALSDAGANVILVDINEKLNQRLEKNISKKYKTKPLACNINISKKEELLELKKQIMKKFGRIDGLVNNAFFSPRLDVKRSAKKFEGYPLDLWNKVISINLTGVFLCCQELGKVMVKQKTDPFELAEIMGISFADRVWRFL